MKIGLALGGGGARGAVHIGVLEELNALGIRPNLITGTSIGGLVGALAAYGLSTDEMKEIFKKFSVTALLGMPNSQPAIASTSKFEAIVSSVIGRPTFADLKTPLAVVATNIVTHQEVVLDEGDLNSALKATLAFPILFPPVEREGLTLIDGGLVNNLPFDVARARGCNFVIAVSLGNSAPYGTPPEPKRSSGSLLERALNATKRRPLTQVVTAVADIITNRVVNTRMAISQPDVFLHPDVGTITLLDFHMLERGIEIGRQAVREAQDELKHLVHKKEEKL